MRRHCTLVAASLLLIAVSVGLPGGTGPFAPSAAHAQNFGQRVVSGYVLDAGSTPVVGATVFLKNLKTKSIRSFTTVEAGKFHFAQVSMLEDQELWAEKGGKKSPVKSVSSWDTRKEVPIELKLK